MQLNKIIYLQDGKLLFFDGEEFTNATPKSAKKFPVGATIPSKMLHTYLFKTSDNVSAEQLDIQVEIQAYESGGLDPNVEYVIDYLSHKIKNSDSLLVEVLAVPQANLEEYFKDYTKKIKAIDYVVPTFLIYKSLYTRGITDDKTDLFIYFSDKESLAVIFKNGKYISHIMLDSLEKIAENCASSNCNEHLETIKRILAEKGFDENLYDADDEYLYTHLTEVFTPNIQKIIHVINNKRSIFGIDGIDRIWLDFNGKNIPGFDQFYSFLSYDEVKCKPIEIEGVDEESVHSYVSAAYFLDIANSLYDELNFTIYERKPPIYKLELFKIALFLTTGLFLNVAVDGFFLHKKEMTKKDAEAIKVKLESQKKRSATLQKKLNAAKKRSEELNSMLKKKAHEIDVYKSTLVALDLLSRGNLIRERFINDILVVLENYDLSISKIVQKGNNEVEIDLIAEYNQRERIAKFIETLANKGYKDVSTKAISLNNGVYESTVRIVR